MWWHGDLTWWEWLGISVAMLGFWTVLIWGVVVFARGVSSGSTDLRDPEAVLAERFAAGEIDEDEYRRRLDVLRATPAKAGR